MPSNWTLTDRAAIILKSYGVDDLEAARAVVKLVLDEAVKACKVQSDAFLSPEYATGQPLSSHSERFACGRCVDAIRALGDQT